MAKKMGEQIWQTAAKIAQQDLNKPQITAKPEPEEEMYVTIFKEKLCSGIHYSLKEAKKYYVGNNPIYKLTKVTE